MIFSYISILSDSPRLTYMTNGGFFLALATLALEVLREDDDLKLSPNILGLVDQVNKKQCC